MLYVRLYYYDCVKYYFTLILQLGDKEIKIQSLIPIVKELGLKFSIDSGGKLLLV